MKTSLKKVIQSKFDDIELNDMQLDTLLQMQTEQARHDEKKHKQRRVRFFSFTSLALSAMVLIAISLAFNLTYRPSSMADAIAAEVTHNHFKLKPLEVESPTLDKIGDYFTKLDFKPIPSQLINAQGWTLLGARYCSLQGITAAQIRYQTPQGELRTFYEVIYDPNIYSSMPDIEKGETPIVSFSKGVGVKMWVEKGILMAMTF